MIHLIPACGKLSSGLAVLIAELGFELKAYDSNPAYPMLSVLENAHIEIETTLPPWESIPKEDTIIIGNSLSRGHPWVERALVEKRKLWSMPEWLHEHVLSKRKVIAVAGTHGKTSVTAMIAWLLKELGEDVGYLIGGVAMNLPSSAHLGSSEWFVIEADEYDTAWFDKRAKFFWYWPSIAVLNHVEYDHPDIYPDEASMFNAYRLWLRMLPSDGKALISERVDQYELLHSLGGSKVVFDRGVECHHQDLNSWVYELQGQVFFEFNGKLQGHYHAENVWLAAKVAQQLGFDLQESLKRLESFEGVQRRMTWIKSVSGVDVYDDFAHHPTALASVCKSFEASKIHLVIYPSNAMWRAQATAAQMDWSIAENIYMLDHPRLPEATRAQYQSLVHWYEDAQELASALLSRTHSGDVILTCSSDDMDMLHQKLND